MNSDMKRTGNQVTVVLTANEADLTPMVRSIYNRLRNGVDAKGFRPGKAPNNIVDRELGTERVHAEIINAAAGKLYRQAVEKHDLRPINDPHVAVRKFVPFTALELELTVEVMPEVKLAEYTKLKKTMPNIEVTAKEVGEVLNSLQDRLAKRNQVERPAKKGDEVTIDFSGQRDGKDIPGAQAQNYALVLGGKRFIQGFEDHLTGLKPGDSKKFDITFPQDYPEATLRSKKVTFNVTIKKVSEVDRPKLDATFAKETGPFKDLDSLKRDIKNHLKTEKQKSQQQQLENEVVQEVVDKSEVELPENLVKHEQDRIKADLKKQLSGQDLSEDEYARQAGKTQAEMEQEFLSQAKTRVKAALVITEVAKQEKLEVKPDELEIRIQVLAGQYKDEKIQEQLNQPEVRREIANQLLTEKTVKKLVEYATQAKT